VEAEYKYSPISLVLTPIRAKMKSSFAIAAGMSSVTVTGCPSTTPAPSLLLALLPRSRIW